MHFTMYYVRAAMLSSLSISTKECSDLLRGIRWCRPRSYSCNLRDGCLFAICLSPAAQARPGLTPSDRDILHPDTDSEYATSPGPGDVCVVITDNQPDQDRRRSLVMKLFR